MLNPRPPQCSGCPLHDHHLCSGFAPPFGKGSLGVLVIAEALGEHEAREGRPLVPKAQAGSVFARALKRMGLDEQQFVLMNAVNCFDGSALVRAEGIRKIYRRWYRGPVLRIHTDRGAFSATPNHPIFTIRGMLPMQEIAEGDEIIYDKLSDFINRAQPNINYGPARFDELFASLAKIHGGVGAADRPINFHGDGVDGEIEIITIDGKLPSRVEPAFSKRFIDSILRKPYDSQRALPILSASPSSPAAFLDWSSFSAHGIVGSAYQSESLLSSKLAEPYFIGCAACPNFYAESKKSVSKAKPTHTLLLGKPLQTFASEVSLSQRARVLKIEPDFFIGHVYNLETSTGKYTVNDFLVSNCRPQGNKLEGEWYEQAAIEHCRQYISGAMERFRPRAILTLGNVGLRAFTGLSGSGRSVTALRGYCLPASHYRTTEGSFIPVIPSYHPSYIARGAEQYLGVLMHDIGKAIRVAQGKLTEPIDFIFDPLAERGRARSSLLKYNIAPDDHAIRNFLQIIEADPDKLIAYDIETDFTRKTNKGEDNYEIAWDILGADGKLHEVGGVDITQIQFSLAPGTGIALPWNHETANLTRKIAATSNPKAAHNGWRFDNLILRMAGISFGGTNYDTMTMFHHLQPDLPADLQFVGSLYEMPFPWKHLNETDLAFYGIADVDCVQRIMQKLPEDMRKRGVWDSYCEFVRDFQPLLERMQNQGIRIDLDRRAEFKQELETEKARANAELQALAPKKVKPSFTYKMWPIETREFIDAYAEENVIIGPKGGRTIPVVKMAGLSSPSGLHIVLPDDKRQELIERYPQYEWRDGFLVRVDEFLSNSPLQLKKLILHYGEKVPLNLDDDETTEALGLVKLIEKLQKDAEKLTKKRGLPETTTILAERKLTLAKQLELVLEYRKLHKMYATYVEGWKLGPDEKVHTTFTFRSATWQLTSLKPNVQNAPVHGTLAPKFQRLQIASPGRTLLAFDYGGCHLKTLAFEMEDLNYYRMACIDGHSTIAAIGLKLTKPEIIFNYSDEEWKNYIAWFRSNPERERLRHKFKCALLGIQLGLMGRKLYNLNTKSFNNEKEAQGVIDMIKSIFPKIPKWQQYIKDLAHRQGFLLSRYGGIRWFWSVYRWDAIRGTMVSGEDAEAALAFFVQNNAFGKKRESMLDLAAEGLDAKYGMNNDIHDCSYFDCPNEHRDEALWKVKQIMELPARKLVNATFPNGLIIQTDVKMGPSLGELQKVIIK